MGKLYYLIAVIVISTAVMGNSIAVPSGYTAYNDARLTEAINYFQNGYAAPEEARFLQAALTTDAEAAIEIYKQIVLDNPETEIAKRSLDRIRQYYYAQGLYSRASEIEKTLGDWKLSGHRLRSAETTPPPPILLAATVRSIPSHKEPVVEQKPETVAQEITREAETPPAPPPITQPKYVFALQVGAFASPANAESLEEKFEKAGYQVDITPPSQNGTSLHIVRVIGYATVDEAFTDSEKIQKEFKITPIVVPY